MVKCFKSSCQLDFQPDMQLLGGDGSANFAGEVMAVSENFDS